MVSLAKQISILSYIKNSTEMNSSTLHMALVANNADMKIYTYSHPCLFRAYMSIIQEETVKIVHILLKRNECWYFDTIIPGISVHIPLIIITSHTFSLTFRDFIAYHHTCFGENERRRWRRNYSLNYIL